MCTKPTDSVLWLLIAAVLMVLAFALTSCRPKPEPALPSISEIQTLLNELEPENPIKVDGRMGPLTIAKWDRVCCELAAANAWREFERGAK